MRVFPLIGLLWMTAPAGAEVLATSDHAFEIQHRVSLTVPPAETYAAFTRIGQWWNNEHTYSGDGKRMSLDLRPGGCWCEPLDGGGGVEHMRVALLQPGERIVFTGSLGPLLYEATSGVMDVRIERIAGGSRLTLNYRASGFAKGGATGMAPLVDGVLGEQMKRLRAYAVAQPKS